MNMDLYFKIISAMNKLSLKGLTIQKGVQGSSHEGVPSKNLKALKFERIDLNTAQIKMVSYVTRFTVS